MNRILILIFAGAGTALSLIGATTGRAGPGSVFNMPAGQNSVQFVNVGDPGNAPDSNGHGAVAYSYQIGTYDVTAAQYAVFLNAVAASDPLGLWNSQMASGHAAAGILQNGSSGNFTYGVIPGHENFPVNYISWGSAARFVNWLQNGQPMGVEGPGTTETGAYSLNRLFQDTDLLGVTRNPGAHYVIPTDDEWYKAAYYKGGSKTAGYWSYATKSNTTPSNILSSTGTNNANVDTITFENNMFVDHYSDPVNFLTSVGTFASSPGPYGTFDQQGDVSQWTETLLNPNLPPPFPPVEWRTRGGTFSSTAANKNDTSGGLGPNVAATLRIAIVPEPGGLTICVAGAVTLLLLLFRRRAAMRASVPAPT